MGWGLCLLGGVWHHEIRRSRQSAKNDLERNRRRRCSSSSRVSSRLVEAPTASSVEANRKHTSKKLKASLDSLLMGLERAENTTENAPNH